MLNDLWTLSVSRRSPAMCRLSPSFSIQKIPLTQTDGSDIFTKVRVRVSACSDKNKIVAVLTDYIHVSRNFDNVPYLKKLCSVSCQ